MSFKKMSALLLVAMLAVGAFGCKKKEEAKEGAAPAAAPAGNTIKIGFLGALTGDVAMFGKPTLEGMKMAADEINAAGGIQGKKIEIVEADNRGDKQEGASVTQKFISRDNVTAIVGDPTTGITKVAAPIAQKAGVVLLSAGATGPGVVEVGDFIFRDTLLDSIAIPACIEYFAKDLGFKKVAIVTSDNNDYSVGLSQTFRDAAAKVPSIKIVADEKVKDGDKDFSAQITNIKSKKPDVILFSGYYTEGALIMKEARKQGLKAPMFGGDGLFSPKFIELGGPAVEGSMSALGFSTEQAAPATAKFIEAFKAKHNGELPGLFDAQGYDAVMLLADSMKRANSVDPKVFKTALAQTKKFEGVSGTISMQANREPIKSPLSLLAVKDGKFVLKAKVPVKMD
ncbi:ABC transporter substrate-binding protein [Geomonas subterranea]|uniref:ABC transporter substrate-binding protein n=1 Tax=Geomonas subterranea TaxID=2847989 RepID=A0ABX8LI67_9BACT|nr:MULTISPECIES: ABC transporter substrate-binding protein [Geomonas]QXE91731.1 ABC transporter substrate-binding protein [Geomonas subterranea]QXM10176.1 ABC transporter substrate-binding protein [Geomonas subterranea]